jgi:golgin subfamily B member 1
MTNHPGFTSWKEYLLHLEGQVAEQEDPREQHDLHMKIARLWEDRYLQKAKAISHFQQAFKSLSGSLEALAEARRIYWELGRPATIERVATLQIELEEDPDTIADIYRDIADVFLLSGEYEKARAAFGEVLERRPEDERAIALAADLAVESDWAARASELEEGAGEGESGAFDLLRAALLQRMGGAPFEAWRQLLERAAALDPWNRVVALLLEKEMIEAGIEEDLAALHGGLLQESDGRERSALLAELGKRWHFWHGNTGRAIPFLDQAWRADPSAQGLLGFLYENYLEAGDTGAAADMLEAGLEKAEEKNRVDLLEMAGDLWGRVLGDSSQAARYYRELREIDPENQTAIQFFEENEMTNDSEADSRREEASEETDAEEALSPETEQPAEEAQAEGEGEPPREAEPDEEPQEPEEPEFAIDTEVPPDLAEAAEKAEAAESEGAEEGIKAWQEAWSAAPGHPLVVDALTRLFAETEKWPALADFLKRQSRKVENTGHKIHALMRLAEIYGAHMNQDVMVVNTYQSVLKEKEDYAPALDAAIEKYEEMERWPDLVKMLKRKGEQLTDPADRVDIWLRVAQLFLQRFSNQAEAIKAFEEVLEADPNHEQAIEFLREMYEKRRDWQKLVGVMQRQAEALEGEERAEKLLEIAKLATERLKRPAICIELWEDVLEQSPDNAEALGELGNLYERAKEWKKLTGVLERQAEAVADAEERAQILQKLGVVYGDKVGDDASAVEAWKSLLELKPDDRRAQEQLKKRYLALRAWDELEQFYESTGKWDEFIRVLEREADKPDTETESSVALQFKIAELWREKKERVDRAARCYEKVLELDENNLRAAEELIPILEESKKDPAKLADVLEVELRHLEDEGEQLALRQRIARIAEEEIEDPERAFEGFLAAFGQMPTDSVTQDDIERAAEKAGRWEAVVEAYRRVLEEVDETDKFEIRMRLARVLDEEVGRPEEALSHYDEILSEDPKNPRAVAALEKIYAQMGRYEELLDIYARRIEMAEDDDEKKEIYYNQALLWEEEIGDADKAIEVYQRIIELAGDEERVLTALDRLYSAEEKWPELADVLQRQLDQGVMEQDAELEIKYRLGEVSRRHLDNKERALDCYREVLALEPSHEKSVAALEELLEDEDQQAEAAKILSPLYEESESWEKLVNTYEILLGHAEDDFEKIDYLMRQGEIFSQRLGSPERAFVAYSRAFKTNPGEAAALEQLEEITAILDCWGELVQRLEEGGRATDDPGVGKDLWLRAARIHDTQLDDVDSAVESYNETLELDSHNQEAIAALEQIYSRTERWSELIGVLRTKVDTTVDGGEKEQIYRQMAMIYEEMLEKPEEAVGCLKEILNIDPTNASALQELDKLYVQLENWTDLADNLQQQLGLEGDPERMTELKLRLAGLRETRLEEVGAAVEIYREIVEVDPECRPAIEALERIVEREDLRRDVATILEPIYRALGEWEKLVGIYEILIEEEETVARKVDLLHEIAQLYETAGDEPEKAFRTFGRALEVDPAEERTQEEIERLARVLVLYDELVELYAARVEPMDDMELAASYHLKIARICEEQLQNVDRAIGHYRKVLEIDPLHLEAATALEGAYQLNESYPELANVYLQKVEMVTDLEEQKQLLFKASQIYEEILDDPNKAIEVYLRIFEIDEDDLEAIGRLEGLYLRLEKWESLQDIYNRKVDLVRTPEEKREVLYVLGAMYEREVQDSVKAIETYQRILEFDPDDFQAIQRLDILYTENEEWHDLLSILEREVELSEDPDEAIGYKFRIGEIFVRHLEDVPRAIEYLRDIISVAPHHEPTLEMLDELVHGDAEPMLAAEVIEPLYRELAEWRKLIDVVEVKLKHIDDEWQRVELMHQAADLLESDLHLDSPGEAFDMYARALAEDKVNEKTLAKLEDLAEQTGRWQDLAELFDAQLEDEVEAEPCVTLGLRVGAIYEEKLDRTEDAIARYQKVLEVDPENRPAIMRLDKLFQIAERWDDLASILQKEALIVEDPEQSLDVQFRLGQVYQQELEDVERAVEVYRDILAAEPAHDQSIAALELLFAEGQKRAEIIEVLEPLYRMQSEWQKLVGLYERQLEDIEEVPDRIAMIHRIAETFEEKMLDSVEAFNWYSRAFSEDPFDERSGEEIERLAGTSDAWSELADLYQDLFARREDEAVKRLVAKRLARVSEEELHDAARAEQAYRGCLDLGGDDIDVLTALDRIYTQYMEWERLVQILDMLADATQDGEEKIAYIHRMGSVYETQLDEFEKARVAYHRIVDDLEPNHQETLDRLEIIYADREAWAELYEIYERMKDATDSEAAQADLYAKMGTIAAECLDDIPKAIELWRNVLDIRGEDTRALQALADMHSREENWSDLVDVLERAVTIAEDDETRINIYSQLGLVWGECLERDRSALENWQNVLMIDPDNLRALQAMAGIHQANQDWESLIETLERVIEVGAAEFEVEELKGYHAKLGRIFAETLERPMEAIDAWNRAAEVDPSDVDPLRALEKLYTEQEMWEELVEVLGKKGELLSGDDQIETWLEQAKAIEEQLAEPLRAKQPYKRIVDVAPLHDHAFEKLVELMTEEESWEELIQLYSSRLNYIAEPTDEVPLLHEAAAIYEERLDQPENAFAVIQRAFEADYSNDLTAEHLERLASVTDKWNELLTSCNQVLQSVQDKETQVNLCLKIGKWYADELEHPEYAIAYYQQVLQIDSDNVPALRLMGKLYRNAKQWNELVEVLKRAVEAEDDPDSKKSLLVDLGEILEEYLTDLPEARKVYQDALQIDPTLEPALKALERMFGAQENWRELIPILRRKIEVLEDSEEIIGTHQRIGEILEVNLGDAQAAIDEYRKILEIDQGHLPALKGLERLFSQLERWQDLLDILEMQLEYATSERERIELLGRLAAMLEEEFVAPEKAAERLEEVLDIDPAHESSLLSLERIYRQSGRWQDLIGTLERHVDTIHDRSARVPFYEQIGKVYATEIDDIDRSVDAYKEILDIDPEHIEAMDELAKLQVRSEDWSAAHETLRRLAETVEEPERKVDLYTRLGLLNEENLMDRGTAVEHFRSALDIEPGHLPALEALGRIHIDEGEWHAASRVLESQQEYTDNERKRSQLQFELGRLHWEKLGDEEEGIKWYEQALESNPDNQQAAEPLVDVYIGAERWEDAERLLDMLVRLGGKRTAKEMQPLQRKLGMVSDRLGNLDKALKAFQTAYEMDTSHLPTLLGLADVLFRREEWDKAFKLYQMVLVHHRDKRSNEEIVDIFYRLGHIKAQLKERRKALNMFDKALELDPSHRPTLGEVIDLHAAQKNFEQVIHFKKVLIDSVDEDDEKFKQWMDIGDIWHDKLKNPQKAIQAYAEASEIKPDNRPVLHKMLPLYQQTKQWQKAVEVIGRVSEMEEDDIKLGRLLYGMAVIYRDEIKSAEDAVEHFNRSLDASLENLKAFEAIDRILTQKKDWKNLERNYRKMLHRIAGTDRKDLEINLWHFLGEIYRTRMGQFDAAAEAFKMAAQLDPDNVTRHEILAELYERMPDRLDDAVEEHQALIRKNPYRVDSYKALRKLYFDHRQYDKAWCLCASLSFLKKADPEEQQFFEQYRTRGMVRAQARLDNEIWIRNLFHPDESLFLGKIFEIATSAVRAVKVQPIKAFGLKKNQKRPPNDTMTFSKTFFYAAQVINLPVVPDLYIQDDKPGGLNFAITDPMASACGANLLSGYSPQDLLFTVTKHLSYYRPEHYIRWVLPTHGELKMLVLAALKLGAPDFKLPPDKSGVLQQYVQMLRQNLNPLEAENLGKVVKRFVKSGENIDLKKWVRAVEITGCRAGLLLSNDLEVAARMIQTETGGVDEIPPKEKIKELVLFSVSEEYFQLREKLGIVIGT